ncbi:MAG: DEAD/DEAH box helicase family protein [Planctomycetes bacterium]|nr:DEAD/DEAH box helicase family protein [Planctomycetota bacterium]
MRSGLTQQLLDFFDIAARRDGINAAAAGRVLINAGDAARLSATVIDDHPYDVAFALRENTFYMACSCPLFARGLHCGHLWAALVAGEHSSYLKKARSMPIYEIVDDCDPKEFGEAEEGAPENLKWKTLIKELHRSESAGGAPRHVPVRADHQVVYWIDADEAKSGKGFLLHVGVRRPRRSGGWDAPRPRKFNREEGARLPNTDDRAILTLLYGADHSLYPYYSYSRAEFELDSTFAETLLPRLGRTERFFVRAGSEPAPGAPCAWDDAGPWDLKLRLEPGDEGKVWGRFERAGESMDLSEPALIFPHGFLIAQGKAAPYRFDGDFAWILGLRRAGALKIPSEDREAFAEALYQLPGPVSIELPAALRFEELRPEPTPRLRIFASKITYNRPKGCLVASIQFDYDGAIFAASDPRQRLALPKKRQAILRDREAEATLRSALPGMGFKIPPAYRAEEGVDFEIDSARLPRVVPELLARGWHVEAEGSIYRAPGAIKISVTSGVDWFDLEGGVEYDGQVVPFPQLLKAVRGGERFVKLGDGKLGILPEEWLKRRGLILAAADGQDGVLRFRPSQAMLLDALLAAEEKAVIDPGFERVRRELRSFEGVQPDDPPAEFRGELRPYQKVGLGWTKFLQRFGWGGCLADDMGLGKTVQALALLVSRRAERKASLVVVPRSLIFNWKAEAAKFAPGLRVVEHLGGGRSRNGDGFGDADVVLTTYGTLRRDAPFLKDAPFDYVILDEAQAIKNAGSATAKAARLLKARHRLAMSGTPIENHLGELWSLMEFLNPGLLGSAGIFQKMVGAGRDMDEASRGLLARALKPFILRRTKEQVAPELPAKTEQTVYVDLDKTERRRYDELKEHYRQTLLGRGDLNRAKFHVLEALLRLRQAACHPGLIDPSLKADLSSKLEVALERIREVLDEGHKALVFSQFTSLLAILKDHLDRAGVEYEYLDGQTRDRAAPVRRFQGDPACRLFLISLKAGGLGLNLTAAEYVFLLDPWWNPAVEAQAIDRTHRIGQDKKVFAVRLVARDTVEEKVLELQQSKRALAEAILLEDRGFLRDLTRNDLELLLA